MKKNVLGIAAAVLPALFCSGLLASCASTKVAYEDYVQEFSVSIDESLPGKEIPALELKKWNVLVLDTENTARTEKMLGEIHASYEKAPGASKWAGLPDSDFMLIKEKLNSSIEKCFNKVSYEGTEGEMYDAIVLRNLELTAGARSGQETTAEISYMLVYSTEGTPYENDCQFLFFGGARAQGAGVLPYPARSYSFTPAIEGALRAMENFMFSSEITLSIVDTISLPQKFIGVAGTSWIPSENPGQKSRLVSDDGKISTDLLRKKLQKQK